MSVNGPAIIKAAAEETAISHNVERAAYDVRNRDKLLMLVAIAARMSVNLLTFTIMARYLGPTQFGIIAAAIAYTNLAALIADFGFALSVMRRASADPERAGTLVSESLLAKAVLTTLVTVGGAALVWAFVPASRLVIFGLAHVGAIVASFGDLMLVISRVRRRYDLEVRIVAISSISLLLTVSLAVITTGDVTLTAAAYAVGRSIYGSLTFVFLRKWLDFPRFSIAHLSKISKVISGSFSYAIDSILTNVSGQMDVLLFGFVLSAHDYGIYQSGARLVQAIIPLSGVMSIVYLPSLAFSLSRKDSEAFRRNASRLTLEMAAMGLVCAFGFALVGPIATHLLYGPAFGALVPLWPGFAAFAMLRMLASSFGIQLAARGQIVARIVAQIFAILSLCAVTTFAFAALGLPATSWFLAAANMLLLLILGGKAWSDNRGKSAPLTILVVLGTAAVMFVLSQAIAGLWT